MYKDYKKSESLDTGFVGGSGILWMFSGIVLGLLVGLGMYYFSNNSNSTFSTVANVQQSIEAAQQAKPSLVNHTAPLLPKTSSNEIVKKEKTDNVEKRVNKFSYYAVLPTLDVPVSTAKPIDTRSAPVTNLHKLKLLEKKVALLNGVVEEFDCKANGYTLCR